MSKYNYARIYMTGFRSSPIDPRVLAELSNNNKTYKSFSLNTIKVKNITLFSEYDLVVNPLNIILSGVDSVYGSNYSGDLFSRITGIAEFVDDGETNILGVYNPEGYHTGRFVEGQNFYDKKGREVYPINDYITFNSSNNLKYTGVTGINLSPLGLTLSQSTGFIGPALAYRDNTYTGVYSGIATLRDNFYDEVNNIVSFFKNYEYVTLGSGNWIVGFNTVNQQATSIDEQPGIAILNKVMNDGTGFASITKTIMASGNISNVKLGRKNLTGYATLTGTLTGRVLESGQLNFLNLVTGNVIFARQNIPTGFINSFNFLNLNSPEELDFILIDNPNTDSISTFTYSTGELDRPPLYFDSLNTLNNIINSGTETYGVTSLIVGSKLKIISATSGENGNLIKVQSLGSSTRPFLDTGDALQSGQTFYQPLTPTGVFTGLVNEIVLATGIMSTGYSKFVTGNIVGIIGLKKFNDTWGLYVSDNRYSSTYVNSIGNLSDNTGLQYTTDFIDESTQNLYNIQVRYSNPNTDLFNDIAQLKIKLNNTEQQIVTILSGVI